MTLDLIGDRWTLLVVRDLLFRNVHTFGELLASPEGIASNILAERLRRLERTGLVERVRSDENPRRSRYELTPKGRGLLPVLQELVLWGMTHCEGAGAAPSQALPPRARRRVKGRTSP